eukprot:Skav200450  [mRNA]  locus=scaffold1922:174537:176099:- [translate_table: standard]
MRRPSGRDPGGEEVTGETPLEKWQAGQMVSMQDVVTDWLLACPTIVLEAQYYHKGCGIAGRVLGVQRRGEHTYINIEVVGTTDEGLLRMVCGQPEMVMRVHKCTPGCSHEEVADDLCHGLRVRAALLDGNDEGWINNVHRGGPAAPHDELGPLRARDLCHGLRVRAALLDGNDEGWINNVQRGGPAAPHDELGQLRARGHGVGAEARPDGDKGPAKEEDPKDGKSKKKKKEKKDKKEKKAEKGSSRSVDSMYDGARARACSQKKPKALFSGTGMDPREKVRARVSKRARKFVAKRGKPSSSSSSTSSSGDEEGDIQVGEENIFQQATKVRAVAENYPGTLSAAALAQMRSCLMQERGFEDSRGSLQPVALQYMRQTMQRKASGGVLREILTVSTAIDHLVRGRAVQALDVLVQRLKSVESSLCGTHWSVSQKLEIPLPENPTITGFGELRDARKEVAQEAQTKRLAALPDGSQSQKGAGKGKGQWNENRKGNEGKKGGKGGKQQDDRWKTKRDEGSGKNP